MASTVTVEKQIVPTKKARVVCYVDQSVKEVIDRLAYEEGRSISNFVEQLLKKISEEASDDSERSS